LNRELNKIYFFTNTKYLIPGVALTVLALVSILLAAPSKPESWFISAWLSVWSVGCYALGLQVYRGWQGMRGGLLNALVAFGFTLFSLPFFGGLIFGAFFFAKSVSFGAAFIFISIGLANAVFYHLLKAPTLKGRQVMDQIEGFKMYLSVAEKERLEILHPRKRRRSCLKNISPTPWPWMWSTNGASSSPTCSPGPKRMAAPMPLPGIGQFLGRFPGLAVCQ
jgi:hypothetical protein